MADIEEKLARFRKTKPPEVDNQPKPNLIQKFQNVFAASSASTSSQEQPKEQTPKTSSLNESESEDEIQLPFRVRLIKGVLCFLLWATLYALFIKLEFGIVYFVVSLLVVIYLNTGRRKPGTKSAYSVFNPNVERLQGQLTAEQLEKNLLKPF